MVVLHAGTVRTNRPPNPPTIGRCMCVCVFRCVRSNICSFRFSLNLSLSLLLFLKKGHIDAEGKGDAEHFPTCFPLVFQDQKQYSGWVWVYVCVLVRERKGAFLVCARVLCPVSRTVGVPKSF